MASILDAETNHLVHSDHVVQALEPAAAKTLTVFTDSMPRPFKHSNCPTKLATLPTMSTETTKTSFSPVDVVTLRPFRLNCGLE